ncbi:MAG: VanZ family protein [Methanosarcina sp.]|uniref:VanZ family protein n=1 Tax=Methanosarcina sp. TaxID=2213 RepID=UPI00263A0693|nr:VanZ family protein [Methanosarcina sp.]MDD3245972.1 VanZ family protein [Methanosarcina sp.]
MLKLDKSRFFISITILYAIMVFYLSVSAGVGDIKDLLKMGLGYPIQNILLANDLFSVMDFLLASLNAVQDASIDPGHVGIYFGLGILLYFVFLSSKNPALVRYSAIYAVCIGAAYGILNEVFQMFLSYRVASIADAFSNLIGLVLAQIFVILFALTLKVILKVRTKESNAQ